MTSYIEIKINIDGDVYRYSGNDVNRTIKNAKKMYMSKISDDVKKCGGDDPGQAPRPPHGSSGDSSPSLYTIYECPGSSGSEIVR